MKRTRDADNESASVLQTLPVEELWVRIFGSLPRCVKCLVVAAVNKECRRILKDNHLVDKEPTQGAAIDSYFLRRTPDDWKPARPQITTETDDEQIPPVNRLLASFSYDRVLWTKWQNHIYQLLVYSIVVDSFPLLEWAYYLLSKNVHDYSCPGGVICTADLFGRNIYNCLICACEYKRTKMFKWIFFVSGGQSKLPMDAVFRTGDLDLIQFATAKSLRSQCGKHCWSPYLRYTIVETRDKEAIDWVLCQPSSHWELDTVPPVWRYITPDDTTMWVATLRPKDGVVDFDLLKWADSKGRPWKSKYIVDAAAGLGRIDIMEWAITRGCPYSKEGILFQGAKYGHLNVVKWVFQMVELLNSNGEPPYADTTKLATTALLFGHVEVLDFIRKQYVNIDLAHRAFRTMCLSGSVAMFDYLIDDLLDPNNLWYNPTYDWDMMIHHAVTFNQKGILERIRLKMGPKEAKKFTLYAYETCIINKQAHVLLWLRTMYPDPEDSPLVRRDIQERVRNEFPKMKSYTKCITWVVQTLFPSHPSCSE